METRDVAVIGLGALGSAAAYHLARRGADVVAFEQFDLGHVRGSSHDTSRIIRTSYGAPEYVRLARSAYRDWAEFERVAGEQFVSITGGLIFVRDGGPYSVESFSSSLDAGGVPYDLLAPDEVAARWPQFVIPDGVHTVHTADSGIVNAARSVAALQMQARMHGAAIRARTAVEAITPDGRGVVVRTAEGDVRARKVVLAADAWTNRLLDPLGAAIPLTTMQEQVTYFKPADPERFDRDRFPVWIWEDDHCFYGFPTYGEPTIKAARDRSDNVMSPEERTFEPRPELVAELEEFMHRTIPGSGHALRTVTCQYAITPDRKFVVGPVEPAPDVIVALGAGHAFKFTPTIGRILAELALDEGTDEDISAFAAPTTAAAGGL